MIIFFTAIFYLFYIYLSLDQGTSSIFEEIHLLSLNSKLIK